MNPSKTRTYLCENEGLWVWLWLPVYYPAVREHHDGWNLLGEDGIVDIEATGHSGVLADVNLAELEIVQAVALGETL